ncbi:MAG: cardiolipin synthase [Phycisphaerae bacterium]|nr:cardiolipin synthase [Phycisphaerae bacterium]
MPKDIATLTGILTYVGLVLGFLLAVVLVIQIVRQPKRSPSATIAWLLMIIFAPWVGVPLYLALGGRKTRRRARKKSDLGLRKADICPAEDATLIDRILRSYNLPAATEHNKVSLCRKGTETYGQLVELIEGATHSIHIATFVFSKDEIAADILQRLARRASEGLEVRLLLDGVGCLHTHGRFLKPLTRAGGRVTHFNPVIHRPFRVRTNLRNHRKIAIADGRIVIAGGTNIAKEYIGPTPMAGRWRDLSFVLEGPAVPIYADIFRSDWHFASGEELQPAPQSPAAENTAEPEAIVQVVPSGPDIKADSLYGAILSAIFQAKKRFWVVTPYFVPDDALQQALLLACHRGVDVRVIVPRKSNHTLTNLARGPYLRELQAVGVKILQLHTMVHAKAIIMDDDLAMIGSSNFDIRSLFLNYEVSMFIYSRPEIQATFKWMESLATECTIGMKKVGPVRDFCEGAARMIAPIL